MPPKLLQYLRSLGLSADASDKEAEQFMMGLEGESLEFAQSLLTDGDQNGATDGNADGHQDADADDDDGDDDGDQAGDDDDGDANATITERNRVQEIYALERQHKFGEKWASKHIEKDTAIADVRQDALNKIAAKNRPVEHRGRSSGDHVNRSSGINVGEDRNLSTIGIAIHDAIMQRAGVDDIPVLDNTGRVQYDRTSAPRFNEKGERIDSILTRQAHDRSRQFAYLSLHEMARHYLEAMGVDTRGMGRHQVSRMAFNREFMLKNAVNRMFAAGAGMQSTGMGHATGDFPGILANIATKTLRRAYLEAPRTWTRWCRRTTAPDFKEVKRVQLGEMPTLSKVLEGAEYHHVTVGESSQPMILSKWGEIFSISWEALVNDDTDAFMRLPQMRGNAAARKEEDLVYSGVLANNLMADGTTTLFSSGNNNLIDGTDAGPPSVDAANDMFALMQKQTGLHDDAILDITPRFFIGPSDVRGSALELFTSQFRPDDNKGHTTNIWNGEIEVITTARLSANSTTAWYFAADPNTIDTVEVMFLAEEPQPMLEEEDGFSIDGRKYKVRHCVAAGAVDYRGLARNDG